MKKWMLYLVWVFLVFGCGDDAPTSECPEGECCEDCVSEICSNGVRDAVETDVDCGGICGPCELGGQCLDDADCLAGTCRGSRCIDPNAPTPECREPEDCASNVCEQGRCQSPACDDRVRNGSETGTDCGGTCPGCPVFSGCMLDSDCASGICIQDGCRATPCGDGILDEDEACDDGNLRDGDNCAADCQQITCKVGEDLATLQDGIDSDCETILIGPGVVDGGLIIDRAVQIFGEGADVSEVQGDGQGPVFTVAASGVHLGFMKISGGLSEDGGGVFHSGGALTLQDVEVSGNTATRNGGGLFSQGGTVSIVESLFEANQVLVPEGSGQVGCGGAIATVDTGIDVESVEIRANRLVHSGFGEAQGAGLCLRESRIGAEKLAFNLNQIELNATESGAVVAKGAAIYASNSELLIIGESSFSANSVTGSAPLSEVLVEGGVIHTENGAHILDTVRVEDSSVGVESNTLEVRGGVIWTQGATWNIFNLGIEGVIAGPAEAVHGGVFYGDYIWDLNRVFVSDIELDAALIEGAFVWFNRGVEDSALRIFRSEFRDAVLSSPLASGLVFEALSAGSSLTTAIEESGVYGISGLTGALIEVRSNAQATVVADVVNSTLATEGGPGLIANGEGSSVIRLFNATLNGAVEVSGASSQFQPANSIIDADPACVLVDSTMVSRGFNLFTGAGCSVVQTDLVGIPATLGPLAYDKSDTMTFAPQAFSLAVNAGNPSGCVGANGELLVVDQRGQPRTDVRCDIGAHESQ